MSKPDEIDPELTVDAFDRQLGKLGRLNPIGMRLVQKMREHLSKPGIQGDYRLLPEESASVVEINLYGRIVAFSFRFWVQDGVVVGNFYSALRPKDDAEEPHALVSVSFTQDGAICEGKLTQNSFPEALLANTYRALFGSEKGYYFWPKF